MALNTDKEYGYHILIAQDKAKKRQYEYKKHKLLKDPNLKHEVVECLKRGWSPEQIAEPLAQNEINKIVLDLNFRCLNYRTLEDFEKSQRRHIMV